MRFLGLLFATFMATLAAIVAITVLQMAFIGSNAQRAIGFAGFALVFGAVFFLIPVALVALLFGVPAWTMCWRKLIKRGAEEQKAAMVSAAGLATCGAAIPWTVFLFVEGVHAITVNLSLAGILCVPIAVVISRVMYKRPPESGAEA